MQKLKSQFNELRSGRVVCHGCCCCCSCIATIIAFSTGTARYVYIKAKEYNLQNQNSSINKIMYTIYASLFFVITTATIIGLVFLFEPNAWYESASTVAVGALLNLAIFVIFCKSIKINSIFPIAVTVGFVAVFCIEFLIWVVAIPK